MQKGKFTPIPVSDLSPPQPRNQNSVCLGDAWESEFYFIFIFWLHWVFVAVCGLLIMVDSLVVEHGL